MARRRTLSLVVTLAVMMMVAAGLFSGPALAGSGDESRNLEQAGALSSDYLCVARTTGQFRLSFTASCPPGYMLIQISQSLPFDYCYSIYTKMMSDDQANNTCPTGSRYVVISGLESFAACYNRYTGQLMHTTVAAGCNGEWIPVFFVDQRGGLTKFACVEENLHTQRCDIFPSGGAQNEIRQLDPVQPQPLQGSLFRLEFRGAQTGTLVGTDMDDTSPAGIQAALESLASIGAGNVIVTALDPGELWTTAADDFNTPEDESTAIRVEFTGALGNQDITDPIIMVPIQGTSGGAEQTVIDGAASNSPGLNQVAPGGTVQIYQASPATDPNNPATYGPQVTAGPQAVNAAGSYTAGNLEGNYVVCANATNMVAPSCELVTIAGEDVTLVNNVDLPGTISAEITDTSGVNEVQTISQCGFGCEVTGGTFTLTFDGQTTAALAANATTAEVDAALEALPNVGAGNVSVTGPDFLLGGNPGQVMSVAFTGALGGQDVPQMTVNNSLTGTGVGLFYTTETVTEGSGQVHTLTADARVSGGTFTLTYNDGVTSSTTGPLDWDATIAEIEAALNALPSISNTGSVTVVSTDPNIVNPQNTPTTKAPVEVNFSGVDGADTNALIVDNTNLE